MKNMASTAFKIVNTNILLSSSRLTLTELANVPKHKIKVMGIWTMLTIIVYILSL